MDTKQLLKKISYTAALLSLIFSLAILFIPEVRAGAPCCNVTGVDYRTGLVTAQNTATGQTFQFKVSNTSLLKTLRVGQGVYADFATKQVSVDGEAPCCTIVNLSVPARGLGIPPGAVDKLR